MTWYHALFLFKGRLNRQGFWIGFALNFLFLLIFANFILDPTAFTWLSLVPLMISGYSLAAVIIKRLHDRNRSGKALAILLVPLICYFTGTLTEGGMAIALKMAMPAFILTMLLLEWGVFRGDEAANAYGEKGLTVKFTL